MNSYISQPFSRKTGLFLAFIFSLFVLHAQVGINQSNQAPDPSAMLDVQSSNKGLLIPRMDSTSRKNIVNPATGLLVYDSTVVSFWYYNGSDWEEVGQDGGIRQGTNGNALNLRAFEEGTVVGDARGENSVDLQTQRFDPSSVASGVYGVIGGGRNNQASSAFSVVAGGSANKATGDYSTVSGGSINTASGGSSIVAGGTQNIASGGLSATLGGVFLRSASYAETVLGTYNETYTPQAPDSYDPADRLFIVGNGTGPTNRSNALTLLKNGNLGLGTSTPTQRLEVQNGNIALSQDYQLRFLRSDGTPAGTIGADFEGLSLFENRGGTTTELKLGSPGDAFQFLHTIGGTTYNRLHINSAGNIGIGTVTPDTKLHLVGQLKYEDGNQGRGFVLSSNVDGEANWHPGPTAEADFFARRSYAASSSLVANFPDTTYGIVGFTPFTESDWQSFLPTTAGRLDYIQLWFQQTPFQTYSMSMYKGEGTSGELLSTTTFTPASTGWNAISFPDEILLEEGSFYTVTFDDRENIVYREDANPNGRKGSDPNEDYLLKVHAFVESYTLNIVNGNVGIGTDNPTRGKVEIDGGVSYQNPGGIGYLNGSGGTGYVGSPGPISYSLYATDDIAALGYNAHSDIRIKHIEGPSDSEVDLKTLMQINITDYRLRDSIAKGNRPIKKVIAQELAEVYPQAVTNTLTEVVPDIYQRAEVQDGWIMLATDLQPGERVKLITEQSSSIYEVFEVEPTRFKISEQIPKSAQLSPVFVYGREVKDFHTVDYEAISMLNVSATQAQQRRIEQLEKENQDLRSKLTSLQSLEARLKTLEASILNSSTKGYKNAK